MQEYHQLSYQERCAIFNGLKKQFSIREIAENINRDPSTVSREIARNSDHVGYFYPDHAQWITDQRKAKHGSKVTRNPRLEGYLKEKLLSEWAPDVIAGCWNLENPSEPVTRETLYAYIYSDVGLSKGLPKLLPRAKKKRGLIRKQKMNGTIPNRVPISERPEVINERKESGHFEADLMFHQGSMSQNVTTISERVTKFALFIKNDSKHSEEVVKRIGRRIGHIAKSVTFDNGSEFSQHMLLHDQHGIKTYFCRPGAPYEKGGVENLNKMSRRWIPFKEFASDVTQEKLDIMANKINHIPRRSLNFITPCEAFRKSFQYEKSECCT